MLPHCDLRDEHNEGIKGQTIFNLCVLQMPRMPLLELSITAIVVSREASYLWLRDTK